MKRMINCSIQSSDLTNTFLNLVNNIMYNAGYQVSISGVFPEIEFNVVCSDEQCDKMPDIIFRLNEFEEGQYEIIPTLKFPTLTVEDSDFYDGIEHWLSKWANLGRYISQINKFTFCPEDYLEEE